MEYRWNKDGINMDKHIYNTETKDCQGDMASQYNFL